MSFASVNIKNKLKGMFVGLAIGDMLGTPLEFMQPGEFKPITGPTKGGHHNLPYGYWTDDTSMALCLADSLLAHNGYNSYDVMNRYWLWRTTGYRSSTGSCFDIGSQTSAAIDSYISSGGFVRLSTMRTNSAGNGCVMRLAPVIIAGYGRRNVEDITRMAIVSARETHYNLEAEFATAVFAELLLRAVSIESKPKILESKHPTFHSRFITTSEEVTINNKPSSDSTYRHMRQRITQGAQMNKHELQTDGYVVHCLQIAVWAFINYDSFKDGALAVANLGGDADTNCAVYCQLAGAFYGYYSIPFLWRAALRSKKEIIDIGNKLIDMDHCPVIITRFEEDYIRDVNII